MKKLWTVYSQTIKCNKYANWWVINLDALYISTDKINSTTLENYLRCCWIESRELKSGMPDELFDQKQLIPQYLRSQCRPLECAEAFTRMRGCEWSASFPWTVYNKRPSAGLWYARLALSSFNDARWGRSVVKESRVSYTPVHPRLYSLTNQPARCMA